MSTKKLDRGLKYIPVSIFVVPIKILMLIMPNIYSITLGEMQTKGYMVFLKNSLSKVYRLFIGMFPIDVVLKGHKMIYKY